LLRAAKAKALLLFKIAIAIANRKHLRGRSPPASYHLGGGKTSGFICGFFGYGYAE
jgi:hypothetical protein